MSFEPPVEDASITPYLRFEVHRPGESSYADLRRENVAAREGYAEARGVLGRAAWELSDFRKAFEEKVSELTASSENPRLADAWQRLSETDRQTKRENTGPHEAPTLQLQAGRRQRLRHPTERSHGAAVVDGAKRTLESDTRRLSYETARSMAAAARAREALATTERVLGDALRAARAGRSSYREFEVDDRAVQGALEAVRADPATAHHAASYADLLDRYSEVRLARAKEMRELRAAAERIPPEVGVPGHEDFDAAFVVKTTVTYLDSRLTREVSLAPLAGAERQQDPVSIVKDAKRFLTREIVALVDQRASIAQMADTARAVLKSDGVKAEAPAPEHRPDRAAAADAPRPPRDAAASPQREPKRTVIQPARPRRTPPGGARRAHNHR